jgi:hypothetical protein
MQVEVNAASAENVLPLTLLKYNFAISGIVFLL